jgi:hypothetical protein
MYSSSLKKTSFSPSIREPLLNSEDTDRRSNSKNRTSSSTTFASSLEDEFSFSTTSHPFYSRTSIDETFMDEEFNLESPIIEQNKLELYSESIALTLECPITFEFISKEEAVLLNGILFSRKGITEWLLKKGTDPISRVSASVKNLYDLKDLKFTNKKLYFEIMNKYNKLENINLRIKKIENKKNIPEAMIPIPYQQLQGTEGIQEIVRTNSNYNWKEICHITGMFVCMVGLFFIIFIGVPVIEKMIE